MALIQTFGSATECAAHDEGVAQQPFRAWRSTELLIWMCDDCATRFAPVNALGQEVRVRAVAVEHFILGDVEE